MFEYPKLSVETFNREIPPVLRDLSTILSHTPLTTTKRRKTRTLSSTMNTRTRIILERNCDQVGRVFFPTTARKPREKTAKSLRSIRGDLDVDYVTHPCPRSARLVLGVRLNHSLLPTPPTYTLVTPVVTQRRKVTSSWQLSAAASCSSAWQRPFLPSHVTSASCLPLASHLAVPRIKYPSILPFRFVPYLLAT